MRNSIYTDTVIATATITNKSENQDCKGEKQTSVFSSIFIADGLGSYKYAKLSSERVIDHFVNEANRFDGKTSNIQFSEVFKRAKQKLIDFSKEYIKDEEHKENNLFGTTVISVLEIGNKIKIAYTGNGAIWHIRGNFNSFPSSYIFPWNAINILNPHTVSENGKEALYRLISDNDDFSECFPSVIEIEKDKEYGDIIMVCTDGIYSADQVKAGKNDKGVWVKYENTMLKFFDHMTRFFKDHQFYSKVAVENALVQYLEDVKSILDDDATVGILITSSTLNHQNEINWRQNENDSGNTI